MFGLGSRVGIGTPVCVAGLLLVSGVVGVADGHWLLWRGDGVAVGCLLFRVEGLCR